MKPGLSRGKFAAGFNLLSGFTHVGQRPVCVSHSTIRRRRILRHRLSGQIEAAQCPRSQVPVAVPIHCKLNPLSLINSPSVLRGLTQGSGDVSGPGFVRGFLPPNKPIAHLHAEKSRTASLGPAAGENGPVGSSSESRRRSRAGRSGRIPETLGIQQADSRCLLPDTVQKL
jgi:hypothetical protein